MPPVLVKIMFIAFKYITENKKGFIFKMRLRCFDYFKPSFINIYTVQSDIIFEF